jgi:hypothetical protein
MTTSARSTKKRLTFTLQWTRNGTLFHEFTACQRQSKTIRSHLRKGLEHTVPRASASIQVLSSECKHIMEIEGRKDGKLFNRAFQCKDTDMHAN